MMRAAQVSGIENVVKNDLGVSFAENVIFGDYHRQKRKNGKQYKNKHSSA
jgi:hypothetical protein